MSKPKLIRPEPLVFEMRAVREAAGLTQDAIGHRSGLNHITVHRIETGKHHPSIYFANLYLAPLGKKLVIGDL